MRNLNTKPFIGLLAVLSVVVLVVAAALQGFELKSFWALARVVPTVITIDWLAYLAFTRWAWRWSFWRGWLVPFPDLNGTWEGHINSKWKGPQGEIAAPIPAILTVRQRFNHISCVMRTGEMTSYSYVEGFCIEPDNQVRRLAYSYSSKPNLDVRHRSPLHDGTMLLDLIGDPVRKLQGEYWTQRGTVGTVTLRLKSRERLDEMPPDAAPHPMNVANEQALGT